MMLQKYNLDFRGKYPHVRVGTFLFMTILDILTENSCFCCCVLAF